MTMQNIPLPMYVPLADFWSDLRDDLIDNAEETGKEVLQRELDNIKTKMQKEVKDGIKGEWYGRLVKLVGKNNADTIWNGIEDGTIKAVAPYAVGATFAIGTGLYLAYRQGQKKRTRAKRS